MVYFFKLLIFFSLMQHKMTNVVHTHGSPLNGVLQCKPELDFYIDKDMIYIADTKVAPRYGDFFVRNIQKFEEVRHSTSQYPLFSNYKFPID